MKVLALIPARSGSKSIPHKNIRKIAGKPMLAYSIEHAQNSKLINRIIVSTDDPMYARIANAYGAETPFLRPAHLSNDNSTDFECFQHAINWLKEHENYEPEACVHLRPTHPVRNPEDIDQMIEILMSSEQGDSIRSVVENKTYVPYKMWFLNDRKELTPVINDSNLPEAYNKPRQELPKTFFQNASIDIVKTKTIIEKKSMTGDYILGYLMAEDFDIDYEKDFIKAEMKIISENLMHDKKVFCFDIDGVIATIVDGNNYELAQPIVNSIKKINNLFDDGNEIILHTARGSKTHFNWQELTLNQLRDWGVKYHKIYFGKPAADYYIDDKAINSIEFFNVERLD